MKNMVVEISREHEVIFLLDVRIGKINKRSPLQNQQACTELTLDGEQRGISRNRILEKT